MVSDHADAATHLDRVLPGIGLDRNGERLARVSGVQSHRDSAARAHPRDAACRPLDIGRIDIAARHDDDFLDAAAHDNMAVLG